MSKLTLKRQGSRRKIFNSVPITGLYTVFQKENEWQKTEPVPIPLPRASRNYPDVKMWNYLQCPIIELFFLVLKFGKFLEALGSGIGTSLVFFNSFSFLNNVSRLSDFFNVKFILPFRTLWLSVCVNG